MGCVAAMWREPIKAQRFEWTMTHCEPKALHYLSYGPPTPCLPMTVLRALHCPRSPNRRPSLARSG